MSAAFQTSLDIGNRALQHVGAQKITAFTEQSKNAREINFVYDKAREAELRRNLWVFATKKAVIRAIDQYTLFPVFPDYAGGTYTLAQVVKSNGALWIATKPTTAAPGASNDWQMYAGPLSVSKWSAGSSWWTGELVYMDGTPNVIYFSLTSGNQQDPTDMAQTQWVVVAGTTQPFQFLYPVGTGPSNQDGSRNVYRLPANYLRQAPRDPKDGSTSWLGAPSGLSYDDWLIEGDFLISMDAAPIIFRFVANMVDVRHMDPMFCEGLALRVAMEVCEAITQSTEKLSNIVAMYKQLMGEARTVNGIEVGSIEAELDDYITCRI